MASCLAFGQLFYFLLCSPLGCYIMLTLVGAILDFRFKLGIAYVAIIKNGFVWRKSKEMYKLK